MHRLQTGLALAAASALAISTAQACGYHKEHVTAGAQTTREEVAISTHDGALPPVAEMKSEFPPSISVPLCDNGKGVAEHCAPKSK